MHLKLGYDLIKQFKMALTLVASVRWIMVSFVLVVFFPTCPRSQWFFPHCISSSSLENLLTMCSLTSSSAAEFLRLDNPSDDIDRLAINELFEVLTS